MDIHSPSRKMRDLVGEPTGEGFIVGFEDAMADFHRRAAEVVNFETGKITANISARANGKAALQAAPAAYAPVSNEQTINIYQPVETPDETARAIRLQMTYGLAGDMA